MQICPVVKDRSLVEIKKMHIKHPEFAMMAHSRWPECADVVAAFPSFEHHFIGRLQSNKIAKLVPIIDVFQSVESWEQLEKLDRVAVNCGKTVRFCWQVNVSADPAKAGIEVGVLSELVTKYVEVKAVGVELQNVELVGLMTIGARVSLDERKAYYLALKQLFDALNADFDLKMTILSMGTSEDWQVAADAGATMVRLGSALFDAIDESF